jgi:transcription elongation factor Elf1
MHGREKLNILKQALGQGHKQGKDEFYFSCPFCDHHRPKLAVNLQKNAFHCWVCDASGRNIRRLVKKFGNWSLLKEWDRFSRKIDFSEFDEKILFEISDEEEQQVVQLPKEYQALHKREIPLTLRRPLNYLRSRGLTDFDIAYWKIGFCEKGKYEGRLLVPSFAETGSVNYFITRAFDKKVWPAYKNPKASRNIVFNELFVDWDKRVVITEGVFDAIVAGPNSIPLLGSTMTENSLLLRKLIEHDSAVYLALDPDAYEKELKIMKLLLDFDLEVYKINIHGFDDLGEMPKNEFSLRKKKAKRILQEDLFELTARNLLEAI